MNIRILLLAFVTLAFSVNGFSADPTPVEAISAKEELGLLVKKISTKLNAGKRTEAELAAELQEFDALLSKYPAKSDDAGQIALMKANLYLQVFRDEETGMRMLAEIENDYSGTRTAKRAKDIIFKASPEGKAQAKAKEAERKANLEELIGQPAPELNFKWSSREGLKTLSDLKGQVVVLDFWATWCGPCISSFPKIREHVEHFKSDPVTFLGVTSIQGRVSNMGPVINTRGDEAKEFELMTEFMELKNMTWDVVFSEEKVFNPEYFVKGIPYVAIVAPDGTIRHAGLHANNPSIAEKVQALLEEFEL